MKILNNFFNKNNIVSNEKQSTLFEKTKVMGSSLDQLIKGSSVKAEEGLTDALRMLKNENIKLDSGAVKEVNNFLKNSNGTLDSKLETIGYAAQKGVDITEKNLTAMHSALNDSINNTELIKTLSGTKESELKGDEALKKIDEMDIPDKVKVELKKEISSNKSLKEAVSSVLAKALKMDIKLEGSTNVIKTNEGERFLSLKDMVKLLESTSKLIEKFGEDGANIIKDILSSDLSGENILKALSVIDASSGSLLELKDMLANIIDSPTKDSESLSMETNKTEMPIVAGSSKILEAEEYEENDDVAENKTSKTDSIENDLLEKLDYMIQELNNEIENENIKLDEITSLIDGGSNFKFFVVKEITQKIIDVKAEFVEFQKYMKNSIDNVLIEPGKTKEYTKTEILELTLKAAEKLDDIIMKSDITLYTSMKGERDLVKMSSDLLEARTFIEKGDIKSSLMIISSVREKIENMKFDPSIMKVEGHLKDKANILNDIDKQSYAFSQKDNSPSGRNVVELMRSLGLNHEYEVSEKLHYDLLKDNSNLKDNAKMALLKLMQDSKDSKPTVETIEKSLNNLTGQQLLNRNNPSSDKQTLMFNIPIETPNEIKNLKLYVNGREKSNALDWENCSLYFVIETKNYGMTGIKIDIKDRNVNIVIKNDDESIEGVAQPLLEEVLNEFTEIGLKSGTVNFRKLNLENDKPVKSELKEKNDKKLENNKESIDNDKKTMEGFDFKI